MKHLVCRGFFRPRTPPLIVGAHVLHRDLEPHDHDFIEFFLILRGSAEHHTILGKKPLSAGDLFLFHPGAWHSFQKCKNLLVYNCCFSSELLECELHWLKTIPFMDFILWNAPLLSDNHGILEWRLSPIERRSTLKRLKCLEEKSDHPSSQPSRQAMMGHLLLFLDEVAKSKASQKIGFQRQSKKIHFAVKQSIQLMEDNLAHPWTIAELSQKASKISRSYLSRIFKKHTGLAPLAWLGKRRITRGSILLLKTDKPIAEVSAEVGLMDPNYFTRKFRILFGTSPSTFRRKNKPESVSSLLS